MYVTAEHALSALDTDADAAVQELPDRAEILDALHRFDPGQDLKDKALSASAFAADMDTTHRVTNPRITVDGDSARLTALVEARHLLTAEHAAFALLKNLNDVEPVRDGLRRVFRRLRIDNDWYTGAATTIFGN
ncbi:hypothetical protein GCM10022224_098460 [Nonomuraea antimicrobica]|uniref:SnoaL-like domain-containing protein n=1 Tax=Nonomuraea antimicrobica TaxID=561173 RepID=A0ABP7EDU0_9ACTN